MSKEDKYGILDLDVKLENGEIINIEMQLENYNNMEERTTFHACKKIVEQLTPGQLYKNLKKVIVIAILDYSFIGLPDYVTRTVRVAKDHREYEINNGVEYIYIELKKFRKQNPDMNNILDQWLAFLDMEREELLKMAMEKNEEIKKAVKQYEELTGDAEVKRLAEVRLMAELEEKAALASARERGTIEGEKIGREQGEKIEREKIAKNMKSKNVPIEDIMEFTGLTKEEIEKL